MDDKNDLTKKRFLFGAAFVALSIIVLLIIFLVNKDTIFTNLKETDFFGKIFGSTPAVIENHQVKHDNNEELPMREEFGLVKTEKEDAFPGLKSNISSNEADGDYLNSSDSDYDNFNEDMSKAFVGEFGIPGTFDEGLGNNSVEESGILAANNTETEKSGVDINEVDGAEQISSQNILAGESQASVANVDSNNINPAATTESINNIITKDVAPKVAAVANSYLDLCFVMIDGDGAVLRKMIKRAVPRSDSPLTTAINLLLEGPDVRNKDEVNCRSLIPEGSRLLSARVADGVAYLNFNEDFEFNTFGVEGAIHQLEQVVYTATAFSTVNSVQFLIEGEKREYLGSEGQWIGTPLSRANF